MHSRAHFLGKQTTIVSVFLAAVLLVACDQSKTTAPAFKKLGAAGSNAEKVFVVFEGPWAIVDDPKDANNVLVLAPKLTTHNDLYVAASNDSALAPGAYELSVPAHGPAASGPLDPTFAQGTIDPTSLQHALDDKTGRYVVRLPKPEAYVASRRFLSRVGKTYPPDPSSEQNYATFVVFLYNVASLNGFSLSGTPDTVTFNPLLLQLDTPYIHFAIEQPDAPPDPCHNHSRGAFRDTVKYLGLTLYVDFPNDSPDCHKTDPQITQSSKVEENPSAPLQRLAESFAASLIEMQSPIALAAPATANRLSIFRTQQGTNLPDLVAALFLFHAADGACRAPILFLTATT